MTYAVRERTSRGSSSNAGGTAELRVTNPVAFVVVFLLGIVVLATLAVVLSSLLPGWLIIVGLLLMAGVLGYLIAPPRV